MTWGYDAMGQPVPHPPPPPPVPAKKGSGAGVTALVLCLLAGGGHIVLAALSTAWYGDLMTFSGSEAEAAGLGYRVVGTIVGQSVLSLLNLAGIIVAIVAIAADRGRIPGILGLLLGLVLPSIAFLWFGVESGII